MTTWRDNLRPGSFRGVAFEVQRSGARMGRRGAHFEFPNRDKGAVEDLGLKDRRFRLDAYVIGDDYMDRRNALEAALLEPGIGELIHPTRGALQVVLDVTSDVSVRESFRQGRMALFSIPFLLSDDAPQYPSEGKASSAKTEAAAATVLAAASTINADRIILGGPADILRSANDDLAAQRNIIDDLGPAFQGISRGDTNVLAPDFSTSSPAAVFAGLLARMETVLTVERFGIRVLDSANAVARAVRALLASTSGVGGAAPTSIAARRIVDNRLAIAAAVRIAAISYGARALVSREYDSHGAALGALREFDQAVETVIRSEADIATGDASLVTDLTILRAEARDELLANAANLIPVARVDPGVSLPSLALAWRLSGGIEIEGDVILRNGVEHPMWCPADDVSVRIEEQVA